MSSTHRATIHVLPSSVSELLLGQELGLPKSLQSRINVTKDGSLPPAIVDVNNKSNTAATRSFILYLPTVVLRKQHNPGFALAVRLANHFQLPLIVLGVVLDDAYYHKLSHPGDDNDDNNNNNNSNRVPVVFTARKLAFTLQAFQLCAKEWSDSGASVLVRVHGPKARIPHHLTLAQKAVVTVTDEPFVYPYCGLVESVERNCCGGSSSPGAVVRVDGSTTVPPVSILQRHAATGSFIGVPNKAWRWQKQTDGKRKWHILAAVQEGELDAPELLVKCPRNALEANPETNPAIHQFPPNWLDASSSSSSSSSEAPGRRPWTVQELCNINVEQWVLQWPGVDTSVPVCIQTHGAKGNERWRTFSTSKALSQYAKRRNDIRQPHAVSRMSCYLNLGTVSILQMVYDLMYNDHCKFDTRKFEDEVIKWREIGYVHCFATPGDYFTASSVPAWARNNLSQTKGVRILPRPPYSLQQLATASTKDATWNAMQEYLMTTGELHNNARMTWGKTVVEWQKEGVGIETLLTQLAVLNDRFALDGLSPPSYAGLLWCLGWCDKPAADGGISRKPASRYRVPSEGFKLAQQRLLAGNDNITTATTTTGATGATHDRQLTIESAFQRRQVDDSSAEPNKKAKLDKNCLVEESPEKRIGLSNRKKKKSITDYFAASSSSSSSSSPPKTVD